MAGTAVEVFISYSHKDEDLRQELDAHLKILERQGYISTWHDRKILPGDEWDNEISTYLEQADLILLLVSAPFLASDYCWNVEISRAIERHEAGEAIVVPIIMRPVDWEEAPFSKLQAMPKNAQPVVTWMPQDSAFSDITKGLRQRAKQLIAARQKTSKQPATDDFIETLGNGVTLEMVKVPSGRFWMGSPDGEEERSDDEGPLHSVTVPAFWLGKYPVTQAQWSEVAALPKISHDLLPFPSRFKGSQRPVESISWHEAVEFCQRLSQITGRTYRLPSEAEWEYACRARTTTPFYFGETITTEQANYDGNYTYGSGPKGKYRQQTTDVGSFPPNAFGLYDMHGNVREWCHDVWHSSYEGAPIDGSAWIKGGKQDLRIARGGSWDLYPRYCRSAYRNFDLPGSRFNYGGFRVVCSAPGTL
ncbi:SUMF1/EgtB/PvdO family nonheme iron enzyme [Sphaerothrix gracilis]|uniref:SUMF1/EgtB/PvdO family nonheme iron enzyme n=1 Tax=Sphaerothrix gracilis TaxID=3151835 RepID=UPI0031FD9FEE